MYDYAREPVYMRHDAPAICFSGSDCVFLFWMSSLSVQIGLLVYRRFGVSLGNFHEALHRIAQKFVGIDQVCIVVSLREMRYHVLSPSCSYRHIV